MRQVVIDCQTRQQTIVEVPDIDIIVPPKTDEELKLDYDNLVVSLVRGKYTENDELAILRKKLAGLDVINEFEPYSNYVEECKTQAHLQVYGGEV